MPVARQAMERREQVWMGEGRERAVAAPVMRQGQVVGAVTVTLSLASVEQLGARGRQVTLWFAIPAIVALTLLVDLLARRLVHRRSPRFAGPCSARERASSVRGPRSTGPTRSARWPTGLNEMLGRLEQFQAELQARVEEATGELRETNARLVESYQRVLGLREALAQAEQLAALGQMAANVAHQIGTPLNLISGYVQVMIEETRADRAVAPSLADRRGADPEGDRRGSNDAGLRAAAGPAARDRRCRGAG